MLPLGMFLGWLGYGFGSWGYILVKGYNVTLREWFSPLHPYQGALDVNGCVPKGFIFPVKGKGGPCTRQNATPGAKQQVTQGKPHPGSGRGGATLP